MNPANDPYSDYFVSDGFNSIKCHFSEICKETFGRMYPQSIKIYNIVNMLICIKSYYLILRNKDYDLSKQPLQASNDLVTELLRQTQGRATDLEVVLVIDELRVISFDRFQVKLPASVQYEDQVRVNLGYMKHFLQKIKLIGFEFDMPETAMLSLLPGQQLKLTDQVEESKAFPLEGKFEQLPPQMSPVKSLIGNKRTADKSI